MMAALRLSSARTHLSYAGTTRYRGMLSAMMMEDAMSHVPHVPAQYFIVRSGDNWSIKFREETFGPYLSKQEALLFAIDAAQLLGAREKDVSVLVEDEPDHFLTRWCYGSAPNLATI
jgi:hypothetical protein